MENNQEKTVTGQDLRDFITKQEFIALKDAMATDPSRERLHFINYNADKKRLEATNGHIAIIVNGIDWGNVPFIFDPLTITSTKKLSTLRFRGIVDKSVQIVVDTHGKEQSYICAVSDLDFPYIDRLLNNQDKPSYRVVINTALIPADLKMCMEFGKTMFEPIMLKDISKGSRISGLMMPMNIDDMELGLLANNSSKIEELKEKNTLLQQIIDAKDAELEKIKKNSVTI